MRGLDTKLVDGAVVGGRIAYNPSKWIGLELFYAWDHANVQFKTPSGTFPDGTPLPTYSFGGYVHQFGSTRSLT